jgi:hypothetical protein
MVKPNRGPARLSVFATGGTPGDGCVVNVNGVVEVDDVGEVDEAAAVSNTVEVDCANTGVLTATMAITQAMRFIRILLGVTYARVAQESCRVG